MDGQTLRLSGFIVYLKRLSIRVKCWTYSNDCLYCYAPKTDERIIIDLSTGLMNEPDNFEDDFYAQGLDYLKVIYQDVLDYTDYKSYNLSVQRAEEFNDIKRHIDYVEGKWRTFLKATTAQQRFLAMLIDGHTDDQVRKGYIALGGNLPVEFRNNYEGGVSLKNGDYTLDYVLDSLEQRDE